MSPAAQAAAGDVPDRRVILGPETGCAHLSAVLVTLPPGHELPLHTHPGCEDCFFVLSGAGRVREPRAALPIHAPCAVWIPPGHPHGLAAGPEGIVEVGFQSPPGSTAVPFRAAGPLPPRRLRVEPLPLERDAHTVTDRWTPIFREPRLRGRLDPRFALLDEGQGLRAAADDFELVVVVARGAVRAVSDTARELAMPSALHVPQGSAIQLEGLASPTLLIGVRARAGTGRRT